MKNYSFSGFANNTKEPYSPINTNDATATSLDIVTGKTAYVSQSIIAGNTTMINTFDATATADDILVGKTAYVKGQKITGTNLVKRYAQGYVAVSGGSAAVSGLAFQPKLLLSFDVIFAGYANHYGIIRDDYSPGGFMTLQQWGPPPGGGSAIIQGGDLSAIYPSGDFTGSIKPYVSFVSNGFSITFNNPTSDTNIYYFVME